MIKLRTIIKEVFNRLWTKAEALPIASAIGGKVVGSVALKGQSNHDLDIRVEDYNATNVERIMKELGFDYSGSMVVSPSEVKKIKKPFGKGWQRAHIFINRADKRIDVWHDEND